MPSAAKSRPELYDRLNALLHTMRCIEQREPELCALLNEIKVSGKVTGKITAELRTLLDKMPDASYADDLHAVTESLGD